MFHSLHSPGVNQEEYDTRHILEDITRFELSMISGYVELLGAALDSAIRTVIHLFSSAIYPVCSLYGDWSLQFGVPANFHNDSLSHYELSVTLIPQEPDNWLLYYTAALYHRSFTFELGPAIQCSRRALALAPIMERTGPVLTLSNLLFQARNIPSATTVALELLQTDPGQVSYTTELDIQVVQVVHISDLQ